MSKKAFKIRGHLADALNDTVVSAQNNAGELHVEIIPLRKISLDPENPRDLLLSLEDVTQGLSEADPSYVRKLNEKNSLESMVRSIVDQGVINPIVVYQFGEHYRLIAGERRTLASILAGRQDIPARVLTSKPNALKLSLIQWIENIEREDLSLWERLQNLEKILTAYVSDLHKNINEITATDISKLIGCSLQQASNYRNILNSSETLKKHIQLGEIKNIDKAVLIANSPKDAQPGLIKSCIEGATLATLKTMVNERKKIGSQRTLSGRPKSKINLGVTESITVAKNIITVILEHPTYQHLTDYFSDENWDNHKSLTESFKKLLKILERA